MTTSVAAGELVIVDEMGRRNRVGRSVIRRHLRDGNRS